MKTFDGAQALKRLRATPALGVPLALLITGLAVWARFELDPVLPDGYPYVTFFPAIILVTFVAGLWPGVVAGLICGIAAWCFFIPPFESFALNDATALALAFYAFIVCVQIGLIHGMTLYVDRLRDERARGDELAGNREVLFNELQHRVSNNLQVVGALLKLQTDKIGDPAARRALNDASSQLTLIAKIQRRLHDPRRQSTPFGSFAEELCRDALYAAGARNVTLCVRSDDEPLHPDQTAPVGLILLECVNNALEHAFPDGREGRIDVDFRRHGDDRLVLTVCDNGRGLPDDFRPENGDSLGLKIVKSLAAQIGGEFALLRRDEGGADGRLSFPRRPIEQLPT